MADEIRHWLEELGLGGYADAFAENRLGLAHLSDLTEDDLRELGVAAMGDRKMLLRAIANLDSDDTSPISGELLSQTEQKSTVAERRQLTVMFCDLVGSTALSTRLDPEDYREVIRAYQDACAGVITRYDGYVAKFMGDGVLAYFGWPRGHEDDAERAINAGLGVVEAVASLALPDGEIEALAVRIGIATGPVVVGDIVGEGSAQETAVTGETPNLAARLQEIAEPNTVAIAETTHTLAGGLFAYDALGEQSFKGIGGETQVWRVTGEQRVESRFAAAHAAALTPLIGREEELELLSRRWERAKGGEGQLVLLSGEPGIGKSRLVHALVERLKGERHRMVRIQCSPHHANSAMHPFVSHLDRVIGFGPGDTATVKLNRLVAWIAEADQEPEEIAPLLGPYLGIDTSDRYPPAGVTPQRQKELLLEAIAERQIRLAAEQPTLFVVEDAHWIDPTSLELLGLHVAKTPKAAVLIVVTYRPEFIAPWVGAPYVTTLTLNRLSARDCTAMAEQLTGEIALPPEVLEQLIEKTDGVPLFIEELTRSVLETHALAQQVDDRESTGTLDNIAIPATLQDALEARFDRSPTVRAVAQIGAAIGREFTYDLMTRVAMLPSVELDIALDDLSKSGLIFARGMPPNASYTFKHALVQDTAYRSLLRTRRKNLHAQIAETIEKSFPESAASEPEVLAHHFTQAGLIDEAVSNWQKAGTLSAKRPAFAEAEHHFNTALELLSGRSPTEDIEKKELELRLALGPILIATKGMGGTEVGDNYIRAQKLGQQLNDFPRRFAALFGVWVHNQQTNFATARKLSNEMLELAEPQSDRGYQLQAHHTAWTTSFFQGNLAETIEHSRLGWEIYDLDAHKAHAITYGAHDPGVCSRTLSACAEVLQGRVEKAERYLEEGHNLAKSLSHPGTTGQILGHSAITHQLAGNSERALQYAEAAIDHCEELGLRIIWRTSSVIVRAWCMATLESDVSAIAEIEKGINAIAHSGTLMFRPYFLGLLADAHRYNGRYDDAMSTALRALKQSDGAPWWRPELYRLIGQLQIDQPREGADSAELSLNRSLRAARDLEAKTLELRTSVSLARLWQSQGKTTEAHDLLSPVYSWFTEGFGTPHLQDAKALLDELT